MRSAIILFHFIRFIGQCFSSIGIISNLILSFLSLNTDTLRIFYFVQNKLHCLAIIIFCYVSFSMIIRAQKLPAVIKRNCKVHIAPRFYCSGRFCHMVAFTVFQNNMTEIFF